MFKIRKEEIVKFLKEDAAVMGVDLVLGAMRVARDASNRAARLVIDGKVPAPAFLVELARSRACDREEGAAGEPEETTWGCCEKTDYRCGGEAAAEEKTATPEPGSPAMAPPKAVKVPRPKRAAARKPARTPRAKTPRKKKTPTPTTAQ